MKVSVYGVENKGISNLRQLIERTMCRPVNISRGSARPVLTFFTMWNKAAAPYIPRKFDEINSSFYKD